MQGLLGAKQYDGSGIDPVLFARMAGITPGATGAGGGASTERGFPSPGAVGSEGAASTFGGTGFVGSGFGAASTQRSMLRRARSASLAGGSVARKDV